MFTVRQPGNEGGFWRCTVSSLWWLQNRIAGPSKLIKHENDNQKISKKVWSGMSHVCPVSLSVWARVNQSFECASASCCLLQMAAQHPFGIQTDLLQHPHLTMQMSASTQNDAFTHSDGRSPSYSQLGATAFVPFICLITSQLWKSARHRKERYYFSMKAHRVCLCRHSDAEGP